MKTQLCAVSLLLATTCLGTAWADPSGFIMARPSELKWADATSLPPGAKVAVIEGQMDKNGPITAQVKFPANFKIPPHWHPNVERVTVLSGTLNYGMGDRIDPQKTTALGPGSVIVMPPKMHHFAWTTEETVVQLNVMGPWGITYINSADDPRLKK
ncbi:cupin domain-containing protein [Neisseriaceae bacterium JH1-16]|nr:cupin domain-containing protein [Neisseriaceae bacterium JH1-16]